MSETQIEDVSKMVPDIVQEQIGQMKEIFPECISENGKVDFDKLKAVLGEIGALKESDGYQFTWAGKEEAFRSIQVPSGATLKPAREESINFDETENIFIEGENLEALKLLYKAYHDQVKMIYIDPPYNTGNDFVYQDDFSELKEAYLERTGQKDAEGNLLSTNTESSGRFHSNWLNMMYPRLFVARQMLRDDGLIFVSIDNNEASQLKLMMDEIFGEENFVEQIAWKNKYGAGARTKGFIELHEYILCYSKSDLENIETPMSEEQLEKYDKRDEKYSERGGYLTQPLATTSMDDRPNLKYPIEWEGEEIWPEKQWIWSKERVEEAIENNEIVVNQKSDGSYSVRYKKYARDEEGNLRKTKPVSFLDGPYNQSGTKEVEELFGKKVFDFPKPSKLIRHFFSFIINEEAEKDGIYMDFFAGSAPAAQAVMDLNFEDGGNRKFVCIQLPEQVPEDSIASKEGFNTVADIGKERIRRYIEKKSQDDKQEELDLEDKNEVDLAMKVFELTSSNFKQWEEPETQDEEVLMEQIKLFDSGLIEDAKNEDVLYEVILKEGYSLNSQITEVECKSNVVYQVNAENKDQVMLICLDEKITEDLLDEVDLTDEKVLVCQDAALTDSLKVNLSMQTILKVI